MFLPWPNAAGKQKPIQIHHAITSTGDLQPRRLRAFSGKVESGFPFENATNARKLEHIQFPWKLYVLLTPSDHHLRRLLPADRNKAKAMSFTIIHIVCAGILDRSIEMIRP